MERWGEKPRDFEQLPESAALWAPVDLSPRMRAIREVIGGNGLAALTSRERRAFCLHLGLVIKEDSGVTFTAPLTLREVGKLMRVKVPTVQKFVERAAEKLRELCHKNGTLDL